MLNQSENVIHWSFLYKWLLNKQAQELVSLLGDLIDKDKPYTVNSRFKIQMVWKLLKFRCKLFKI